MITDGSTGAEASSLVKRIDFLEMVLGEMGALKAPEGKDANAKVEAVFNTYWVDFSIPAYAVINTGATSREMQAAWQYGLSADHSAIIAAALRAGLITTESMPSKTDFLRSATIGWAAGVLAKADNFMHGTTKSYTEQYLSDEVDYYILYGSRHQVLEYIFTPYFWWEETDRLSYSEYTKKQEKLKYGYTTDAKEDPISFIFMDTVYKMKDAVTTVPQFSEEERQLVLTKRISDIGEIRNETERRNFAEAYMLGLIKGESDGEWLDTRHFNPNRVLKKDELPAMFERLSDRSKRYVLSPDFKMTRTTDLPESYMLYPYILDSYPNLYYDTGYEDNNGLYWVEKTASLADDYVARAANTGRVREFVGDLHSGDDLIFPFEINRFISDDSAGSLVKTRKNLTTTFVDETVEFYKHILNIDYRTIADDTEWHDYMTQFITEEEYLGWLWQFDHDKRVVSCDIVAADLSGVYYASGSFKCKVYVHFIQEGTETADLYERNKNGFGFDTLIQTATKIHLWNSAEPNPINSYPNWPITNRYDGVYRTIDGAIGLDELGVWTDHMCVACGIPFEEGGEVRFSSGLIRSTIAGEENGMAAVRQYMKALGY